MKTKPKYVRLYNPAFPNERGTAMELIESKGTYYRTCGDWSIGSTWKDGKLVACAICSNTANLAGLPFKRITKAEWQKDNGLKVETHKRLAKIASKVIELDCGYCESALVNPRDESYLFYADDKNPLTLKCDDCQQMNKTPEALRKGA